MFAEKFTDKSNGNRTIGYGNDERRGEEEEVEGKEGNDTLPSHLSEICHVPYLGLTVKLDECGDVFYKLVNDRRSVRKFNKNRTVDRSIVEKCILAAGRYSIEYI